MAVSCGIVGLPNVGESTLFNAMTAAGAEQGNYPFCTIDPNVAVVDVTYPPPGSTWSFQFLYRDLAGGPAGFNLTNAVELTLQ